MGAFVTQGGISSFLADRNQLKVSNPFLYKLLGGDAATDYTETNLQANEKAGKVVESVKATVVSLSDVVSWIVANWQVSIVGALALLLLIKRL